ncbi:filamentous hemagglutinin N-terminal domain-containing protein, partial [Methylobacter psychrophilus]|uniref:filamentous hemagglutinin N-terminal domain-containing protein n=1 Tax=Methylobacter psychrophilus TaxID=96941 RepID=UPI0021D4BB28
MNKVYSLVWNELTQSWVPVSEIVMSRGKRVSGALLLSICGQLAAPAAYAIEPPPNALPTGGQIVSGQAGISQNGADMKVQQGSDKLIANWESFNIGKDASVTFDQPSASSAVLNRVASQDPSQIMGKLSANGQVYIVNPSGVVFGKTSQVNVGGLVASTLDISDQNFKDGKLQFSGNSAAGAVLNQGQIEALKGGMVAFIAPVVQNQGNIKTPDGNTVLAAGEQVDIDFNGAGLVSVRVNKGAVNALADNQQLIEANNGSVILTAKAIDSLTKAAVNNSGIIEAKGMTAQGGRIMLDGGDVTNSGTLDVSSATQAGGNINVSGDAVTLSGSVVASGTSGGQIKADATNTLQVSATIDARGTRDKGGSIVATGERVDLLASSVIDASGNNGGGKVLVGGDFQGKNPEVKNAKITNVAKGAVIRADATTNGDGGKVIVWADDATQYQGHITAKGGEQAGNGGFAEVSGKGRLGFQGIVDLTAAKGRTGDLLLDPHNITIQSTGQTLLSPFTATVDDSIIQVSTLATALDSANVTVSTGADGLQAGNITVANNLGWFSTNKLTLNAAGAITINPSTNIQSFDGSLELIAGSHITQGSLSALRIGGTTGLVSGGNISLTSASNQMTGVITATVTGNIALSNAISLVLGNVSAGGAVTLLTAANSGSITSSGTFAAASLNAAADGTGGVSIADINGPLTVTSLSGGGAMTLGNTDTGALIFDSASGNVITGNDAAGGQASGIVTITGASIALNDAVRTKGGNINLISTTGAVTASTGANIVTTADIDTGTASGLVTVTAATGMTLKDITTTGASNTLGVGSNAAAVTLTATTGDINVGAITTSGGLAATNASYPNRNGGNAGSIILGATGSTNINLYGDLNAIGGLPYGLATQGLGGYINLKTAVVLMADRVISSGETSGYIDIDSTVDSDATSRSLAVTAGTGNVTFNGIIGAKATLKSLSVTSSTRTDIEKNVTTDGAAGISVNATSQIRLGEGDVANGLGAITLNTLAGNGTVSLNSNYTYLDDATTFIRGSGAISFSGHVYSNTSERNNLTFDGAGGGAVSVGWDLGGNGITTNSLGDILFQSGTDLTVGQYLSGKSFVALNNTGRLNVGSNSNYSQTYDGALGYQIKTTGTKNNFAGDESIYVYGNISVSNALAPISIATPNGAISFYSDANLTTAGGEVILKAGGGALTLGTDTDITTNNGRLTLTGTSITQSPTNSVLNSGSGKIRIDGGGAAVSLYGRLISTDNDSNGTPSILVTNVDGGGNAAQFRSVETQTGTFQIGLIAGDANLAAAQTLGSSANLALTTAEIRLLTAKVIKITSIGNDAGLTFTVTGTAANGNVLVETLSGANAGSVTTTGLFKNITSIATSGATAGNVSVGLAANDAVSGSLYQYVNGSYSDNQIDIKTLSAATTGSISITSAANVIDQLGSFAVGSSLDVRAKGRVTGMALTGDVTATAVTIMTGNGALVLGSRNITATTGDMILQGKGLTQDTGSLISGTGLITIWGSDYSSLSQRGNVTMAGSIVSTSTNVSAVTLADLVNLTLPNITIGSSGARGGLRLGNHEHNGVDYRRVYGVIGQTAGTDIKTGALDIRQLDGSGVVNLSVTTNEIQTIGYVERGGAITIYDKDTEANGLAMSNFSNGGYSNLLTATTKGAMTMSGYMYGAGVQLSSGAAGITSSADIRADFGASGDLILDAGGGNITLTNRLYNNSLGKNIVIQNANNVQLQRVEIYNTGKLILGGALTGTAGALTGNVTQTSYISANSDSVSLTGLVNGTVTLNNTNQLYRIGDFTSGGSFSVYNQDRNLIVNGALISNTGGASVRSTNNSLTVGATGSVTATAGDVSLYSYNSLTVSSGATVAANTTGKSVVLTGSDGAYGYTLDIQGAISAGSGGITVTSSKGYVSTSGGGTLTTTGAVTIASASNYTNQNTNYTTTINAAVSAGVGGNNNITINSAGSFSNNSSGTLLATGSLAIKTYWDGTNKRNLTLAGNVTAGNDGIKLTSSGTINQTGGILFTSGTLSGANQSGGTPSSALPSARGAVTLTGNNVITNLGPFYLYDEAQVAFSVNDVSGGLTLAGTIENSHGAINISTKGGFLDLTGYDVYAGGMATGGASVALTGQGINQGFGSEITTTGGATGSARTGTNGGGTITLTGHDGTASGTISLAGSVQTANATATAITIRGTSDLVLPSIVAISGGLVLGDDTATIGRITGNITQSTGTSLDINTLKVGTAINAIGGSAVLANIGNKIVQLGAANISDVADTQYDLDIYDSTNGLILTQDLVSAGGIRVRTLKSGGGSSGVFNLGALNVLGAGDIYLGGESVAQAAGSIINADSKGALAIGGSIRIDGGGANNISLLGALTTDNASSTAIQIVNASNLTFNSISATQGTVALGIPANTDGVSTIAKPLTGTIAGNDVSSVISAQTLSGNAGIVTLNKTNIDNLGTFTTTGALTLKDQGGAGTAGLKFTGNVTVGGTTEIQTTNGLLDFDVYNLDASGGTGYGITLRGVGVSQQVGSRIKSTTADIYGGVANIDLFSVLNDFSGQVTLNSTGAQVSLQDANQLSMNALTGKLAPTTSIKLWAGSSLVLTPEDITNTSGSIELSSLDGNLSTPGNLTTTGGNIVLYAATTTTTGNVQVNNAITTGSGNVTINAEKEVNLSKSIISTSGNIGVSGATITHSTGAPGTPLTLQTGSAGTITVVASGTGGFVMGQYYRYQSNLGAISITSGGTADLANITTNNTLTVDAIGLVQQVGSGSVLLADALRVTTANNGAITLTNVSNDLNKVKLQSRNPANNNVGSGVISFNDVDDFAVSQISTAGDVSLTAHGAITTDATIFGDGTVVANALTAKTLNATGSDILLTAAANDINTLTLKVRNADDSAIAGNTTGPAGTIRFTDSDGFSISSIETGGSSILTAGATVVQTGAVVSAKLGLSGTGSYTLNSATLGTPINQISTFASDATGAVNLSSYLDLTIGAVNPTGITTNGADITILAPSINSTGYTIDTQSSIASTAGGSVTLTTTGITTAGNLTVGNILTSGSAAAGSTGSGGGSAGNITLTATGDTLSLDGTITARGALGDGAGVTGADGKVKLTALSGAVSQLNGTNQIGAGLLLVNALNTSNLLNTSNAVAQVAAKINGVGQNFTYRSGSNFGVGGGEGGVNGITTQGGFVDIGSNDVGVSATEVIITKGGAFSATGVRSFNSSGVTISTAGDITYSSGTYKNGGTITIATTANSGAIDTGTLISSGDVNNAADATAGSITLNANSILTIRSTTAQGKGTGIGGAVSLTGSSVNISGSVDTSSTAAAGGFIQINGPAVIVGGDRVLATGSGAGNISFTNSLNSDSTARGLTLTAGTGDISFAAAVGNNSALGALNIVSAKDVTVNSTVNAASLTQQAGTGSTTLSGPVTLSGNMIFTGNNLAVNAGVGAGGYVQVGNAGLFSTAAAGDITATGGFTQNGIGANQLAGNINTTNTNINFATAVALTGDVLMGTDTGIGNIVFANTVDSDSTARDLTLSSGTGNVTFSDIVGGLHALDVLTVNSAGLTKFSAAVSATSLTTDTAGTVQVNGQTVTTTGTQTYNDALTLGNNTTLTGSIITTNGTVGGGSHSLHVIGDAVFGNQVTDIVTGLTTLEVTGATIINTDTVNSADAQTYTGAVTLGTSTTLTATDDPILFSSTVNSSASAANALTINAGIGAVTFTGAVGGAANGTLGALAVNSTGATIFNGAVTAASVITNVGGTVAINGGAITTSGIQTYGENATLGANTILSGAGITFTGSLKSDGTNRSLAVNDSATTTFTGAVGSSTIGEKLASLTTDAAGNTVINGGAISTTGTQAYSDNITLGANTTLSGSTITTHGTVAGGTHSLAIAGDAVFGDAVTDIVTGLTTLAVSGTTLVNTNAVTSSGTQGYSGAVTLGADTTVSGSGITFTDIVKSDGINRSLAVNDSATTTFGGAVGSGTIGEKLASLTTNALGTTAINGGAITTTGAQTFGDNITLGANTTLSGSTITTNGTVAGGTHSLAIAGDAVFGNAATDIVTGLTTLLVSGTTAINTNTVTSSDTQGYSGAVTLGSDTTISGSGITFTDIVKSDGTNRNLTVNDSGTTAFIGAVGSSTSGEELASLTTDAAGNTAINGGAITTTGAQTFGDNITLGANTTLSGSTITTNGTVAGGTNSLTITGDAVFGNAVTDIVTGLTTLAVSGTTAINTNTITSADAQTYTGAVTLGTSTTLTATDDPILFSSTVNSLASAANALTVNAGSGAVTFTGAVGGAVNGTLGALAVNSTGATKFQSAVTAASVVTNVGGTVEINGGAITTSGIQSYGENATLGADTTLTGAGITFTGSLKSAGTNRSLAVNDSATTTFGGALGSATAGEELASLTTDAAGNTAINGGAITTTGAQTFGDNITLGANTTLSGSTITTNGTVAGGTNSLAITGNAVFGNQATDIVTGLTTLAVSGTTKINTDTITTTDSQNYAGAVTLGTTTDLTSGNAIGFGSTVDGDGVSSRSLRLTSGNAAGQNFVAAVGGIHALDILRIESAGVVTQGGSAPIMAAKLAIKSAGNVTMSHVGNNIDVLAALLSGDAALVFVDVNGVEIGKIDSGALQIVGISDGAGASNVSIKVGGALTQAINSPILINGNLTIDSTAYDAADVALQNIAATGTKLDNSLVAGDFALKSTGDVTQKADANGAGVDAYLQVGGSFDLTGTGQFIQGNSPDNLIGGGSATSAANEIRLFGVITLSMNVDGDLVASADNGTLINTASILAANLAAGITVVSDAGGKGITAVNNGAAITLGEANSIGGLVKITTQGTYSNSGIAVATGILQGSAVNLASANFLVQESATNAASVINGAGKLNLSNAANIFSGTVSATAIGMDVHLREGTPLVLGNINARNVIVELDSSTSSLAITQASNTIVQADSLLLRNAGAVTLNNANRVGILAATLNGGLAFTNNQSLSVGTASAVDGIAVGANSVALHTTSGNLMLNKGISVNGAADITLASAANFINNVGASALTVGTGNWQVWSTAPASDTLGGLSSNFKQYNAIYGSSSVLGTGNGLLYALAPELTVTLTGTVARAYDSFAIATLTQDNYSVSGQVADSGDAVILSTAGTFNSKNVGVAKNITVNPLIMSASSGAVAVYGYQLAAGSTALSANIGNITKATISAVTGITADDKTYNGTTAATLQSGSAGFTGMFTNDVLTVASGATGVFSSANANITPTVVNISGISLDGTDAGNYILSTTTASTNATINKAALTLGTSAVTKTYDGSLAAAGTAIVTSGMLYTNANNSTLDSLSGGTFAFTNANAGTGKTVTTDAVTVNDGNLGGNYTVSYANNAASIIDKATL